MRIPPGRSWDNILEAVLIRAVIIISLLVLGTQVFLGGDQYGPNVEPAMGDSYLEPQQAAAGRDLNKPIVTFRLEEFVSLPQARLLVNGEVAGVFNGRYVTVSVAEGDVLQVDGTRYERPFKIEVMDVSCEVAEPQPGLTITVNESLRNIALVRLSK